MRIKLLALLCLLPNLAFGFCGFYVGGATSKLYNNATQVVMMRAGTRTALSMQNNYQGPPENFAMVIPVPVILQKENVKILDPKIFERVDQMSAPRLVEYWEQDPCLRPGGSGEGTMGLGGSGIGRGSAGFGGGGGGYTVTIEAQFVVGEYEIVILSAKDSTGLEAWLADNKYNIPAGAAPFLQPYVEQGSKFFVAKVDISKIKTDSDGRTMLSPLRFHYDSEIFSLPVRLGLINSSGKQDLLVHILAKDRYQTANYENVFIPTNLNVAEAAKEQFGDFYAALFDDTLKKNSKAIVTEYSWAASTCDPCPGPTLTNDDAATLGGDVMPSGELPMQCAGSFGSGFGSRTSGPEVTEGMASIKGTLDKDLIRRVIRRAMPGIKFCYEQELVNNPSLSGKVKITFVIDATGKVTSATPETPNLSPNVDPCVARKINQLSFPAPQGGGIVEVTYPFTFKNLGGFVPSDNGKCTVSIAGLTLTRLHARYSSDSLGEDLVFEIAEPIVGGREVNDVAGALEQGAQKSPYNNFQARYIIRHPWEGEVVCQNPTRGIWGGPPNNPRGNSVKPAQNLAFAKRGGINLKAMLLPGGAKQSPAEKKQLSERARDQGLPSFQDKESSFSPSWGFLLAAIGGLLLLLLVAASRPREH